MRRLSSLLLIVAGFAIAAPAAAQGICNGTKVRLQSRPLDSNPFAILELDGKTGAWEIDYGNTVSSVSNDRWQRPAFGDKLTLDGFSFPGLTGTNSFPVQDGAGQIPTLGMHHGTLGTDLLSSITVEFRYDNANDLALYAGAATCDPATTLGTRGLRILQPEFFGPAQASRGKLCPWRESTLPPTDPRYVTPVCPNVPVVYVELEERTAVLGRPTPAAPKRVGQRWAQLDTGYSDTYWPFSVDINEAYLAELKVAGVIPSPVGVVRVSGCGGEDSERQVYATPGWKLNITNEKGDRLPGRWFDSFYLIVKSSKTQCGGIGRMTVPAAQLSSSFLRAFGITILMPSKSEVWIRTP